MCFNPQLKSFRLVNKTGNEVRITNFGAAVMQILVEDKYGIKGDVVTGYDTPEEYLSGDPFFGATVGRFANRIANGKFPIGDKIYNVEKNDGENHLHGGPGGFNNVFWHGEETDFNGSPAVKMTYTSEDGEEGYPGTLTVTVIYSWTNDNELIIDYSATTTKKTVINLTHHSYFNLKDGGNSKITDHHIRINADFFIPVGDNLIPTGDILPVKGTPLDFTNMKPVGAHINEDDEQIKLGRGYDHTFVISGEKKSINLAAEVYEPETGRVLTVFTDQPGVQFYTGNFLDGSEMGHNGSTYHYRNAFCLETQHYPDSPNQPHFPSTILEPGEEYTQKTIYKFATR